MREKLNSYWARILSAFNFEQGIDLTDKTDVLYRRNSVIKNIILVSNIVYTIILTVVSIGNKGNWGLTIAMYPLTFIINSSLKNLINNRNDGVKQHIAMYVAVFYMFLSSIIIYFRLRTMDIAFSEPGHTSFGEAGYILIYYAIIVISLYQDKKMLKIVFKWVFAVTTLLHFTLTHDIIHQPYSTGFLNFMTHFFVTQEFKDIFLRTMILLVFMLVVFSLVSMNVYITNSRTIELSKRQRIEKDFSKYLSSIFYSTVQSQHISAEETSQIETLGIMSKKLASYLSLTNNKCSSCYDFAVYHKDTVLDYNLNSSNDYEYLRNEAEKGSIMVKRLELRRTVIDIIRTHTLGTNTEEFTKSIISNKRDLESDIVFMCDMYLTLRSLRSYKRPYSHKVTMELLKTEYNIYLNNEVYDRFLKFAMDFNNIYES